ncbi:hypothetical protein OHA40_30260 [Nocardia sp. NBC_00508]|uniref:hypothetical protein n=1 Tax=Nocardia sp. NBC_00508 TaxID=2975992 RepID=UPI002E8003FD|nr:hypothetical protein [Nocardia sp. NBC_00508]WUD65838.1 hypothetical protein OHA40_30260 [Nocardia sp. NBC_00508]
MIGESRVLAELPRGSLLEVVRAGACGVEHGQQCQRPAAHRLLHRFRLPQSRFPQSFDDLSGELVDTALVAR